MQLLLEASAFVEEQNENGHTPLMEAASGGHIGKGVVDIFIYPQALLNSIIMCMDVGICKLILRPRISINN